MASLPYKPDFKVMPEGWDGTVKDLDEVHYEISKKEDEMLYQEFVQRLNFNKMKVSTFAIFLNSWKDGEITYIIGIWVLLWLVNVGGND